MSYAEKCFFFDWGNREIKVEEFDNFENLTLRKRYLDVKDDVVDCVSIELWPKEDGKEAEEVILTKDNAMLLATKLMRAVAEMDADKYRESDLVRLEQIELGVKYLKRKVKEDEN